VAGDQAAELLQDLADGQPRRARAAVAVRSWPMVAAAWMPWPVTSPTTSAICPRSSGMTSNQSPPISAASLAGR
jgi:hypothetical protein